MEGDGNCLHRSLAFPSKRHEAVRSGVSDHIHRNWETYRDFVPEERREAFYKGLDVSGVWGDELTLQAFAELTDAPVFVYDRRTMQRIARYGPDKVDVSNPLLPRYLVYDGAHYDALEFV